MKILVLYKALWGTRRLKKSVLDHLMMFERGNQGHELIYWNIAVGAPSRLSRVQWDVVVLHTTFLSIRYGEGSLYRYWRRRYRWLEDHSSIKVAFPQDERYFNFELEAWLNSMNGNIHLYSVFGDKREKAAQLYPNLDSRIKVFPCLTGYINEDEMLKPLINWSNRSTDVFYRAKKLAPWVGRYGQLKYRIGVELQKLSLHSNLVIDASTKSEDVLLGESWMNALRNSKYIVGCEAGGSAMDEWGEITKFIINHRKKHQGADPSFEEIDTKFSEGWDSYDFRALGPRNLEAVVTKTCQILVDGSYSGVLQAGRHYIPVKKDLSDLKSVIDKLDNDVGENIAQLAYDDLIGKGLFTYKHFSQTVLNNILQQSTKEESKNNSCSKRFLWLVRSIDNAANQVPILIQLPNLVKLWLVRFKGA